jgi:hypothetical protein
MELTVENVKNTLPLDTDGYVYMELYGCVILAEDFVSMFEGAELTFESLFNHPNATEGWKNQFVAWHDQEILI